MSAPAVRPDLLHGATSRTESGSRCCNKEDPAANIVAPCVDSPFRDRFGDADWAALVRYMFSDHLSANAEHVITAKQPGRSRWTFNVPLDSHVAYPARLRDRGIVIACACHSTPNAPFRHGNAYPNIPGRSCHVGWRRSRLLGSPGLLIRLHFASVAKFGPPSVANNQRYHPGELQWRYSPCADSPVRQWQEEFTGWPKEWPKRAQWQPSAGFGSCRMRPLPKQAFEM